MEYKRFNSKIVLRIDKGEEILSVIKRVCQDNDVSLATVSGIGAVNKADIGIFIQESKKYLTREYNGSMEIVSLLGNITQMNGEIYAHLHIVLTDDTYNAFGGHLNKAWVGATCEAIIDVIDSQVEREFSNEIGLNLMKFR